MARSVLCRVEAIEALARFALTTITPLPRTAKTRTVPDLLRGGVVEERHAVAALLAYGTDTLHVLPPRPRTAKHYTFGGEPDNDIVIASPYVSRHHGRFTHIARGVRVSDLQSTNGKFFQQKRRRKPFDVEPGQVFYVGARSHGLLALSPEMLARHAALTAILGFEDEHLAPQESRPSPSEMIVMASGSAHLLITGEPHCGQHRLARIVHEVSPLRTRPLVELNSAGVDPAELEQAATFLIDLGDQNARAESALVEELFDATARMIVIAPTMDVALGALGWRVEQMDRVSLRPLSRRKNVLPRLVDQLFAERGSPLRFAGLTPHNQAAISKHAWRDNFAALREAVDRWIAIAAAESLREAAGAVGVAPSSLHHWFKETMGMTQPLDATGAARAGEP